MQVSGLGADLVASRILASVHTLPLLGFTNPIGGWGIRDWVCDS